MRRGSTRGPNDTQWLGADRLVNRIVALVRRAKRISDHGMSVVGRNQAIQPKFGPTRTPQENWSRRTNGQVAPNGHHIVNHVPPPTKLRVGGSSRGCSDRAVALRRGITQRRTMAATAPTSESTQLCATTSASSHAPDTLMRPYGRWAHQRRTATIKFAPHRIVRVLAEVRARLLGQPIHGSEPTARRNGGGATPHDLRTTAAGARWAGRRTPAPTRRRRRVWPWTSGSTARWRS